MKNNGNMKRKTELVSPAGSLEKLELAYRMGADSCYIGSTAFSMRTRQNHVGKRHIAEAKEIARSYGKKLYVCINTFPHNGMLKGLRKHIEFLNDLQPDAIVFADPSVLEIVREIGCEIPLHLSVQTSTANYLSVKFWQRLGIKRVILARELSLKEIIEIKNEVPGMEFEAFVHGSVCMAYSGRCFLSSVFSGRDANNGMCAHNCRDSFDVISATVKNADYGEQEMVIEEDIHGSHIISSRDMCLLPHLDKLIQAGIDAFKIEGRNKSEYYVAVATRTYRRAIDNASEGKPYEPELMEEISKTSNRGFFSGFYFPELEEPGEVGNSPEIRSDSIGYFAAAIRSVSENSIAVDVKGKIVIGDELRLLSEKYGDEKIVCVNEITNHRGEPAKEVSSGVTATLLLDILPDKSWEGLLLQKTGVPVRK